MKRDIRLYLQDIWESILAIEQYIEKTDEQAFYKNMMVQDAVLRRLEIIGEAVKNLDKHFRDQYPETEWKKIAGMRDVLAHEYFGVRLDRIWDAVKNRLPAFKNQIQKMRAEKNAE